MDVNEISISVAGAAIVVTGLVGLIWRNSQKKLEEVSAKAEAAASRDEVTRVHARIDVIEARSHDEIRDLRQDMNGLGQRLETAFSQQLAPIHQMLTALINGKNGK